MSYNNNSRVVVSNQQVCDLFKRFFGTKGEKKPATIVTTSGNSVEVLHSLVSDSEPTILHNASTDEYYVCSLLGKLSSIPEAAVMYVDCKKNIVQLFDQYHHMVTYLGITIGHIHDIVNSVEELEAELV